jgi:hypothetical protein
VATSVDPVAIRLARSSLIAHVFDNIYCVDRVLVKRWWNGRYGRLVRRDVMVWTTEDRTRWMVEARRGGAEGRSQFKEVSTGHEALDVAESWRNASQRGEWKDISQLGGNPPQRRDEPG